MQLSAIDLHLLQHELKVADFCRFVSERQARFATLCLYLRHLAIRGRVTAFLGDDCQHLIVVALRETSHTSEPATDVRLQIEPLQRCPHFCVAVGADRHHAHERQKHRRPRPRCMSIRPHSRMLVSTPFMAHDWPPVTAAARRSCALWNLPWSASSASSCKSCSLSSTFCPSLQRALSRIIRSATNSASRVCSMALGFFATLAFACVTSTSRHHSPSVKPSRSATATSCSYSPSVIFEPTVRFRS